HRHLPHAPPHGWYRKRRSRARMQRPSAQCQRPALQVSAISSSIRLRGLIFLRSVYEAGGGSCRPPAGDDYLNDHEPIGSVRCVVGEAGIYQKVILVDLEKAVKAVGSVIAGGHLGF